MGREVRRVPEGWEHPRREDGSYIPLSDGASFESALEFATNYDDEPPVKSDYMPMWSDAERTHWQMYEDASEGTPISPVMPDADSLADWLVANDVSRFGFVTGTRNEWMRVINGGFGGMMMVRS